MLLLIAYSPINCRILIKSSFASKSVEWCQVKVIFSPTFLTNISAECWADGDEGYLCHPHGLDRGVQVDGDGEEGTEEVYECKVVHDVPQVLNILLSLYLLEDFSNYWIPIISDNSLHIVNTMFDSNLMQDITNNQNIKLRHETNRKFL